jgi:hypothetical protein
MESLRNLIRSYMDSDNQIINDLDEGELQYIADLMRELNDSGKRHTISRISKNEKSLNVDTSYNVTYIRK